MIIKTLEIGWHEAKPIYSCDFQRKTTRTPAGTTAHKFATAGADTHIRVWLIHPTDINANTGPRAEYLSTLTKHAGAVNVVRWSPNGELLASAADDGMLIIWTKDEKPQASVWGRDPKETALDKESWRVLNAIRVTSGEVYDLAWSPTGEYIITGSTDNTARIFSVADASCVREIADHAHYVQGVAWDPMNEYIATQSSDRSVKVYSISHKHGAAIETHPVGSNTRMVMRGSRGHSRSGSTATANANGSRGGDHSRAPSLSRPSPRAGDGAGRTRAHVRRSSISSEASSVSIVPSHSGRETERERHNSNANMDAPLTPATSVASGFGGMFLPPGSVASTSGSRDTGITPIKEYKEPRTAATSRRSSFSGSQAPGSPASFRGRTLEDRDSRSSYGRSPSPMPPLPAIRTPHNNNNPPSSNTVANAASSWISTRLYGDENATSFFRRLTFSPDGNLLYTPAGWFEDNNVSATSGAGGGPKEDEPGPGTESSSCVYVYSKANFSKAPVAAYPGHRRAVVCVKFSNALYELRPNVAASSEMGEPVTILLEPGKGDVVDIFGSSSAVGKSGTGTGVGSAGHGFWMGSRSERSLPSPALSAVDGPSGTPRKMPSETPPPPPVTPGTGTGINAENGPGAATASVFNLPYRMMFAVATHDTVAIHDTQQAGPVCLMTKLHYDSFTDMAWSHDGHVLMLASSDGYCTVVVFDENMPLYHTQQRDLQLKSVALAHSHPLINPHPHGHGPTSSTSGSSNSHLYQPQTPNASSTQTGNPSSTQSPLVHPPPSPFVPPYAQSPAVSIKDLPGPSGSGSGPVSAGFGPGTLKRSASSFDVPLTPAASVGGDGDAFMAASGGGSESDRERERAEEGPAKKRRRVELRHHGVA